MLDFAGLRCRPNGGKTISSKALSFCQGVPFQFPSETLEHVLPRSLGVTALSLWLETSFPSALWTGSNNIA